MATLKQFLSVDLPFSLNEELENKTVEVVYYWYHHMMPDYMIYEVQKALDNADYDTFTFWQERLNHPDVCYLPDYACVFCEDDYIGKLFITPVTMNLLTYSECECG